MCKRKENSPRGKNSNILWSAVQFVYFNTYAKYNREKCLSRQKFTQIQNKDISKYEII